VFTLTQVGPYRLSHGVVMAPLTRMRCARFLLEVTPAAI
jgi:hypothetical protein